MSSALAIASVTHVLKDLLNDGMQNHDLSGSLGNVEVSTLPPDRLEPQAGAAETSRLNLYMYMVSYNLGWRNQFLPSHNSKGDRVSNPPLALDLHYLLTAYGQHELHHEILLGYGMQLLHENPVLSREAIRRSLAPSTQADPGTLPEELQLLSNSGLADQIEQIKISPETLNTEEISRLWTAFGAKYRLHAPYKATVVLIESEKATKPALPVRQRNIFVLPFKKPSIEKIGSKETTTSTIVENQKILEGHFLAIEGSQLDSEIVFVNIGGIKVEPLPANKINTQIIVQLTNPLNSSPPERLKAGIHGVQVIHKLNFGTPHEPHEGFTSNVQAFVLSPKIVPSSPPMPLVPVGGAVQLQVKPAVSSSQRVVLFLNQIAPVSPLPAAYSFQMPPQSPPAPPTEDISIPIEDVASGIYLVRIQVDGAESPLETDANTSQFIGPTLIVP